ncbi:hypothetical protein FEM48_Zijuj01G0147200 [Ziziphus jujuba var. spinosa]|uniref:Uncharacterized protein n=1 Tax=Ziziphus jujuba var. spinosa TaxID=714518 RepID=A0A978W1V4_ZIZJJ|nr:hypothetical protein FEM48_Zijuj01G0147200 [Ziziphus jujuba var. spinosa]
MPRFQLRTKQAWGRIKSLYGSIKEPFACCSDKKREAQKANYPIPRRLRESREEMAGARNSMVNGGNLSQRFSGRLIPKRGQVKMAIVVGLLHTVSSIFSTSSRCAGAHFS